MKNILDLEIKQGSRFYRRVLIRSENGAPIDLTGRTFNSQARYNYGQEEPVLTFTFNILDQETNKGEFEWILEHDALEGKNLSKPVHAIYDIEEVFPDGHVEELLRGTIAIIPEVTK